MRKQQLMKRAKAMKRRTLNIIAVAVMLLGFVAVGRGQETFPTLILPPGGYKGAAHCRVKFVGVPGFARLDKKGRRIYHIMLDWTECHTALKRAVAEEERRLGEVQS